MVHTVLNLLISIIQKFCRLVSHFANQTFARARGRAGLSVIPQDVVIASRPRNKNHSSFKMFHSFLIMRYLFLLFTKSTKKFWGNEFSSCNDWLRHELMSQLGLKYHLQLGSDGTAQFYPCFDQLRCQKRLTETFVYRNLRFDDGLTTEERTEHLMAELSYAVLRTLFDRTVDILS